MKTIAKFALFLATMAFLVSVSLFLMCSFCLTWPIMRKSPREQRIRATAETAAAAVSMIQIFAAQQRKDNDRSENRTVSTDDRTEG